MPPERARSEPEKPNLSDAQIRELDRYDTAVATLVCDARIRFIANMKAGKEGWDRPRAWYDDDEPFVMAKGEIDEVIEADHTDRLAEAGDALNFLAFGHNLSRIRLAERGRA